MPTRNLLCFAAVRPSVLACVCVVALTVAAAVESGARRGIGAPADRIALLDTVFRNPPDDARIMMRWWWFGPAVEEEEIARELRVMHEAGIGGVEIQPVYPLALDDEQAGVRNLPFLSEPFLDALRFAAETARELGMRVDITLGSGWPYGGPGISVDHAAGMLRVEHVPVPPGATRVALPSIRDGERVIRGFLMPERGDGAADRAVAVTDGVRDGVIQVPGAAANRTLLIFIAGRTGMQVKRAAVGAEGFVLDHYDRAALDAHLAIIGEPLLKAFGPQPPFSVFCDSLEVFGSDWTADFLDEFQKRRGYDLSPHLPELSTGRTERAADVRYDWGRTLSELFDERFFEPLHAWAARRRTRLRIQGYGTPHATLGSSRFADLPEGEGWQWKTLRPSRWASSAAHVYGRRVASSETWTWLHSPAFRATPLDLKAEADLHFLQGITQIVGHGWPYSPLDAAAPGWHFYAAGAFNDQNPWFFAMPEVARYLQRMSAVLREGRPAADVALYLPIADAWSTLAPGRMRYLNDLLRERIGDSVIPQAIEAGFAFDLFDDAVLRTRGRIEGRDLRLGETAYRAVILPNVERIAVDTAQALEKFVAAGGAVVATMQWPGRAPGFLATEADHGRVRAHMTAVSRSAHARLVADPSRLGDVLAALVPPDVRAAASREAVGFVHRRLADADVYFVANTSAASIETTASFRVSWPRAEGWDPMSGDVTPLAIERDPSDPGRVRVSLSLAPYGSQLIVFSNRDRPGDPVSRQSVQTALEISDGWRVRFGPDGPEAEMSPLQSWTDREDTRFFSGIATYEREVTAPPAVDDEGARVFLDFGTGRPGIEAPQSANGFQAAYEAPVREAADVFVNGRRAGVVWHPPYAVEVSGLLRPGTNRVRLRVGNLAINAMAGQARPSFRLLNLRYGQRFENQDQDLIQPVAAGLLGPIRVIVRR